MKMIINNEYEKNSHFLKSGGYNIVPPGGCIGFKFEAQYETIHTITAQAVVIIIIIIIYF